MKRYSEASAIYEKFAKLYFAEKGYNIQISDELHSSSAKVPFSSSQETFYDDIPDAYDQLLQIDPNEVLAYHSKGRRLQGLGFHKEALIAYEKAIKLDLDFAPAYTEIGNVLRNLNRHEEALVGQLTIEYQ